MKLARWADIRDGDLVSSMLAINWGHGAIMAATYRVVTQGLKEGFSRELATERLAALFKSTKEHIQPLLESKDRVVKKGLGHLSATKYKDALERCGCHCRIETDNAHPSPISEEQRRTIVPRLHRQSSSDTDAQLRADSDASVVHRLAGDLAISFTFKGSSADANITYRMMDALGVTADELYTLAGDNLYRLVHPVLRVQQMRLVPPGGADTGKGMSFFHYLETGGGTEAACLLLAPIWASVKHLLVGPVRIVVPTQSVCMFCGADDAMTFAMMCDIARDTKAEAGASGLSDLIFTIDTQGLISVVGPVDRTGAKAGTIPKASAPANSGGVNDGNHSSELQSKSPYLDKASQATDPGQFTLSQARLREVQPELLAPEQWRDDDKRKAWLQLIADQLQFGDSRAAVVVNAQQGIVAAYTDELDCVALLKFDPGIARAKGWQIGTRLLTVNVYVDREHGIASDLVAGPKDLGNHGNFRPLIADLLTDDLGRIEYRKSQISEDEWSRALQTGKQALAERAIKPRDGRPMFCGNPAKVQSKANIERPEIVNESTPAARSAPDPDISFVKFAGALAGMLLCFWFVWLGVSHFRPKPVDMGLFMALFGTLIFGVVGWRCARVIVRYLSLLAGGR